MAEPAPPTIKFKKRSKASLKKKRLRRADDAAGGGVKVEDDAKVTVEDGASADGSSDDDGGGPSALDAILATERRRKLLGRSRGVDAAELAKASKKEIATNDEDADETAGNKDLEERLKGAFAGGKLAGSNDMGGDDEGGVLAKKHRRAMEEFIQQNLKEKEGDNNNGAEEKKVEASAEQKELYAELLEEKTEMGGMAEGEGDVGAGGAMMGGTGIAEVALPIDDRLRALQATERAAAEHEKARKARFGRGEEGGAIGPSDVQEAVAPIGPVDVGAPSLEDRVPTSFASGPGKRKRDDVGPVPVDGASSPTAAKPQPSSANVGADYAVQSSAHPSYAAAAGGPAVAVGDVGASYSHNFQLHTKEWISQRRDERQSEIDALQAQQPVEDAASGARLGFEAARRLAKGEAPAAARGPGGESLRNEWEKGGEKRSSDDRVWKQFMSNQRNRR
ncbi:hypothetical protein ACHAXT_011211 [Thalassiosira profunda]